MTASITLPTILRPRMATPSARFPEIPDVAAYERYLQRARQLFGAITDPYDRIESAFRDLYHVANSVYSDKAAVAAINYIVRRLDEDWTAYCIANGTYRVEG